MNFIKLCIILSNMVYAVAKANENSNVFTLDGPAKIKSTPSNNNPLNIYCYVGSNKSIVQVWKSVQLEIHIPSDNFQVYRGVTPQDVWKAFKEDTWIQSIFSSKTAKSFNLNPFNSSCLGIRSSDNYNIQLVVNNVDNLLIVLLCVGVFLFVYARSLAENTLFYYLCGITIGILASFLILIYFLSKFLPGKPIVYSALAGCTIGVYVLQLLWSNFKPLLYVYYEYAMWYAVIMGFVSFVVCYKVGPPKDQKSKNIIAWILQACSIVFIYLSTYIFEVFCAITLIMITMRIFPQFLITGAMNFWKRRFPPKPVLLTEEEYYIQGQVETAKALEELRGYCSSPECKQWKVMLSLKDPQRFANFVENKAHLSSDEIEEYESSEFVLKKKNLTKFRENHVNGDLISDDSSLSDEDDY